MYCLLHRIDKILFLDCIDVGGLIECFRLRIVQHDVMSFLALMKFRFTRARHRIVATPKTGNVSRVSFDEDSLMCDGKFLEITA